MLLGGLTAHFVAAPSDGRVSALVHMSASDGIAPEARRTDPGFVLVPVTSHYDGTYFYTVARDPFARGSEHTLIDRAAYRYGHPFYGQLVGLLSWGHPGSVPFWLLAVSLISLGVAGACVSLLAAGWGWTPWAGLAIALSPGLLYATTVDTAEPLVAALLGLALLAWRSRRLFLAAIAFTLLALTKEPMSLVPIGVFGFEAARIWRRDRSRVRAAWQQPRWRRRVIGGTVALAVGPAVLLGWLFYVDHVFGVWPLHQSNDLLGAPFTGVHDTATVAARLGLDDFANAQIGAAALPVVIVLFGALVVGIIAALRLRTLADGVFLVTAPLMFLLGPLDLLYPKDLLRITVIPMLLLAAVFRSARVGPGSESGTPGSESGTPGSELVTPTEASADFP